MKKKIEKIITPVSINIKGNKTDIVANGEISKLWPQTPFGIPNKFLRSALFGIQREKKDSVFLNNVEIVSSNKKVSLHYTGPILNQDDSLIWQIIARAVYQSSTPMGNLIKIPRKEILNLLGKTDGGANFIWLKKCLDRLSQAYISFESETCEIKTNLLVGYLVDKKKNEIYAGISSLLHPIFSDDLTDIDVLRKTKLKTQLSKWLHDFYSSHTDPIPYPLNKLKELSRTSIQNSKFRKMIEDSLIDLKKCNPPIITENSYIDYITDKLIIEKATRSPGVSPFICKNKNESNIINTKITKNTNKKPLNLQL